MIENLLRVAALVLACIAATGCGGAHTQTHALSIHNLTFVGALNPYPADGYSDSWGYTGPDGREYALQGVVTGTSIIDVTDSLKEVAFIPGPRSGWREIKTYQHYAYVATEGGGGIQIIDLQNLPHSAALVGTYSGVSRAHNLWIDADAAVLYTAGGETRSARAVSLANPLNPVDLCVFDTNHYVHDLYVKGGKAYLSEGASGSYAIFNISNPATPTLIHRWEAPRKGFAHNSWPTPDGKYIMTTEETHGEAAKLWDLTPIASSSSPTLVSEYLGPNNMAHNVYIKGNYAYIAHYSGGFRVLDISQPQAPQEVAYLTKGSMEHSKGVWGAYPFLRSGKILLSDMEEGTIVVRFEGARETP